MSSLISFWFIEVAEFECHVLSERMAELEKNLQEAKGAQLAVKTVDTATLEYIEVNNDTFADSKS